MASFAEEFKNNGQAAIQDVLKFPTKKKLNIIFTELQKKESLRYFETISDFLKILEMCADVQEKVFISRSKLHKRLITALRNAQKTADASVINTAFRNSLRKLSKGLLTKGKLCLFTALVEVAPRDCLPKTGVFSRVIIAVLANDNFFHHIAPIFHAWLGKFDDETRFIQTDTIEALSNVWNSDVSQSLFRTTIIEYFSACLAFDHGINFQSHLSHGIFGHALPAVRKRLLEPRTQCLSSLDTLCEATLPADTAVKPAFIASRYRQDRSAEVNLPFENGLPANPKQESSFVTASISSENSMVNYGPTTPAKQDDIEASLLDYIIATEINPKSAIHTESSLFISIAPITSSSNANDTIRDLLTLSLTTLNLINDGKKILKLLSPSSKINVLHVDQFVEENDARVISKLLAIYFVALRCITSTDSPAYSSATEFLTYFIGHVWDKRLYLPAVDFTNKHYENYPESMDAEFFTLVDKITAWDFSRAGFLRRLCQIYLHRHPTKAQSQLQLWMKIIEAKKSIIVPLTLLACHLSGNQLKLETNKQEDKFFSEIIERLLRFLDDKAFLEHQSQVFKAVHAILQRVFGKEGQAAASNTFMCYPLTCGLLKEFAENHKEHIVSISVDDYLKGIDPRMLNIYITEQFDDL